AVIHGKQRLLRIVGTASSPEYVFAMAAGGLTSALDRFAVLWMNEDRLAASLRMEGAFNDLSLGLSPGASEPAVLDAVDRILTPYGGLGALGRSRQPSNHMIDSELMQLESLSTALPAIFLAVAALLVNLVLSRLVRLQQAEI